MTGPKPNLHVTFVCTGNICRSPMAEALFNDYLAAHDETRVRVTSCGIGDWHVGQHADMRALVELKKVGIDGNYYTKYYAPAYNPATMTFHRQNEVKCGDFAFMNAYANFRMKQARFFIMYSHANKGLFGGSNYFAVPHYPLNPGRFQLGVSVNFVN